MTYAVMETECAKELAREHAVAEKEYPRGQVSETPEFAEAI